VGYNSSCVYVAEMFCSKIRYIYTYLACFVAFFSSYTQINPSTSVRYFSCKTLFIFHCVNYVQIYSLQVTLYNANLSRHS